MGLYEDPVWEEPPAKKGNVRYETALAPLLEKPDQWAKIGEYASPESAYQAVLNLRKRKYRVPEPDHVWEFEYHDNHVYAMYLGDI